MTDTDITHMAPSACHERNTIAGRPSISVCNALGLVFSQVVIGETAKIGHNCYILHGVTLGATGKAGTFDRHPKVNAGLETRIRKLY
jgi:UDP-3-O-[3-hydroxymyristoyl] glucosamine N-acyltransferase